MQRPERIIKLMNNCKHVICKGVQHDQLRMRLIQDHAARQDIGHDDAKSITSLNRSAYPSRSLAGPEIANCPTTKITKTVADCQS